MNTAPKRPARRPAPTTAELIEQAASLAGSERKLAAAAGVSQNAIWAAKRKGTVTAELAVAIEAGTAGKITRQQLRPDLFPQS
jgi:DNA-binding transcriptional regulator YdaS (Cro superfamily)